MSVIFEEVVRFLARASDVVFQGRNKTRIVMGTDRKDVVTSGYGAGGRNETGAGAIDVVAGASSENVDYANDPSRLYLSSKSDPDNYFQLNKGLKKVNTPAAVLKSDQVYLIARGTIKIVNNDVSIIINDDGSLSIESSNGIKLKSGQGSLEIGQDGSVTLGRDGGLISERILTEGCQGVAVVAGNTGVCTFNPPAVLTNNNVKIKI